MEGSVWKRRQGRVCSPEVGDDAHGPARIKAPHTVSQTRPGPQAGGVLVGAGGAWDWDRSQRLRGSSAARQTDRQTESRGFQKHSPPCGPPTYQMSEPSLTGLCSMISGDTNSGEPYLLYCGSEGVILWAKPKSQILMSSRAGCTIKMLGGCQAELGSC